MEKRRILMAILSAAAIAVIFGTLPAESANLRAVPSLTLDERWDSNVLNTSTNEESDYVFRASPRLMLSIDAFETTVNLGGGFDAEKYADHNELDKTTATKNIDLTTVQPLKITPRFSLRPSARYVETRDAVRRNQLTQIPEPGVPPSESLVTVRTNVRETSGSLQMTFLLTPNVDLGIGGGAVKRDFTENTPGLFDSRTVTGNASVSYRIDPRLSAGIYADTSYNSYEGRPNTRVYSGGLTGTYALTEKYTVDARAGASLDRTSAGSGDDKIETWSPTGRISINYAAMDFRATLLGAYELAGAGSLGRTTKRSNIVLSLADRFAPRWSWNLAGSVQTNRSTDDAVTEDFVNANGDAGIAFQAAEWASIRLSGNVFRQWSHSIASEDLKRNSVLLGVTLSTTYPVF